MSKTYKGDNYRSVTVSLENYFHDRFIRLVEMYATGKTKPSHYLKGLILKDLEKHGIPLNIPDYIEEQYSYVHEPQELEPVMGINPFKEVMEGINAHFPFSDTRVRKWLNRDQKFSEFYTDGFEAIRSKIEQDIDTNLIDLTKKGKDITDDLRSKVEQDHYKRFLGDYLGQNPESWEGYRNEAFDPRVLLPDDPNLVEDVPVPESEEDEYQDLTEHMRVLDERDA